MKNYPVINRYKDPVFNQPGFQWKVGLFSFVVAQLILLGKLRGLLLIGKKSCTTWNV